MSTASELHKIGKAFRDKLWNRQAELCNEYKEKILPGVIEKCLERCRDYNAHGFHGAKCNLGWTIEKHPGVTHRYLTQAMEKRGFITKPKKVDYNNRKYWQQVTVYWPEYDGSRDPDELDTSGVDYWDGPNLRTGPPRDWRNRLHTKDEVPIFKGIEVKLEDVEKWEREEREKQEREKQEREEREKQEREKWGKEREKQERERKEKLDKLKEIVDSL